MLRGGAVRSYKIKATHNNKNVEGELILCSPNQDKNKYYLLYRENYWTYKLGGKNAANCEGSREGNVLGEELSFNMETLEQSNTSSPKEISMKNCEVKDLRLENNWTYEKGKPLLELTCTSTRNNTKVKIFNQTFERL